MTLKPPCVCTQPTCALVSHVHLETPYLTQHGVGVNFGCSSDHAIEGVGFRQHPGLIRRPVKCQDPGRRP